MSFIVGDSRGHIFLLKNPTKELVSWFPCGNKRYNSMYWYNLKNHSKTGQNMTETVHSSVCLYILYRALLRKEINIV